MPRLNMIEQSEATGKAADLLASVKQKLGMIPNMTKSMANAPAVLEGYLGLSGALSGGDLSPRIREQIALLSAETNGCRYCLSAHSAIGRSVGLSDDDIAEGRQGNARDAKEAAALNFAAAVLEEQGGVSDEDIQAVRHAGFSDGQIAEIVGNIANQVFTNYFNRMAKPTIDFPEVEPACAC